MLGLSLCIQGTCIQQLSHKHLMRFIPVYTGNINIRHWIINWAAVYPCVYREHIAWSYGIEWNFGLSLCIQGTFTRPTFANKCARFIPVYTGNILYHALIIFYYPVYPCVYREHFPPPMEIQIIFGLSLCIQGTYIR